MSEKTWKIRSVEWLRDERAVESVRTEVFVDEQQVPKDLEWDGLDPICIHVLAENADGTAIGTGRLLPDGHIGRMAVLTPWRGQGIGQALLEALVERAADDGYDVVELNAQEHAVSFYEKFGFAASGKPFEEAGISHRHMKKVLPPQSETTDSTGTTAKEISPPASEFVDTPFVVNTPADIASEPAPEPVAQPIVEAEPEPEVAPLAASEPEPEPQPDHPLFQRPNDFALGETDEELWVDTSILCNAAACRLTEQAQRNLYVVSRFLDKRLFDDSPFLDAVSALARRNPNSRVHILIRDSEPIIKHGHRLVQLSQRLSSSIFIRKLHRQFAQYNEAFVLADTHGVLYRQQANLFEGVVNFSDPMLVRDLKRQFMQMWEPSEPDMELTRLPV